ncbi:MAG: allantoicase [Rhodothermales bacterium]|jgi:allantoicase
MTEKLKIDPSYINLASPDLGGAVIQVSDDFFAAAKRMLAITEPQFYDDLYDENGKWMDGWESRRKRTAGHDFCILRICPGVIHQLNIDTSHFTGNFAPAASVEAANTDGDPGLDTQWHEILPTTELNGNSNRLLAINDRRSWSHLRLNIFPDGGIARLRAYGIPDRPGGFGLDTHWIDLVSRESGGSAVACNDMHYGDMANLIKPGNAANMGDGWETRRRRKPGNDWVILKFANAGHVRRIELDTDFFKGNNPAACSLRGVMLEEKDPVGQSASWPIILPRVALGPDQLQVFQRELQDIGAIDHVRLDIFPDGGVARLRLFGEPEVER